MFDTKKLLDQVMGAAGSAATTAKQGGVPLNGLAGGAIAGTLAGLLAGTKSGRKIGKHALTYGGTALLGGLAYKAWRDWQNGARAGATAAGEAGAAEIPAPPADSAFIPSPGTEPSFERAMLRAMVGAAQADGRIDDSEQRRILEQLETLGVDAAERAFVFDLMQRPMDLEAIIAGASCTETAAEIYAASLIPIDPERPAEKGYLSMLAARLELPPELVSHLHANVALAKAGADQT